MSFVVSHLGMSKWLVFMTLLRFNGIFNGVINVRFCRSKSHLTNFNKWFSIFVFGDSNWICLVLVLVWFDREREWMTMLFCLVIVNKNCSFRMTLAKVYICNIFLFSLEWLLIAQKRNYSISVFVNFPFCLIQHFNSIVNTTKQAPTLWLLFKATSERKEFRFSTSLTFRHCN